MKKTIALLCIPAFFISNACNKEKPEEKTIRRVITLENTPVKRPYSPAIEVDNALYVSGQIAIDPVSGKLVEEGIEAQTRQVLINLKNVIEKANYSMDDVVKCTVLLSDIAFYVTVNQIYMEYFPKDPPARMAFAVKDLPTGALIEIDAIAVK